MNRELQEMTEEMHQLQTDIDAISVQLSTADLRKNQGEAVDPDWYHKANLAMKSKRRQLMHLEQQTAEIRRREGRWERRGTIYTEYYRAGERRLEPDLHQDLVEEAKEHLLMQEEEERLNSPQEEMHYEEDSRGNR